VGNAWAVPAPPPLAALAPDLSNLLTVGSLSKLYWGGLRVGRLRAPTGVVRRLAATKAAPDLESNAPGQIVAAHLLRTEYTQLRPAAQPAARGRPGHPHQRAGPLASGLAVAATRDGQTRLCGSATASAGPPEQILSSSSPSPRS